VLSLPGECLHSPRRYGKEGGERDREGQQAEGQGVGAAGGVQAEGGAPGGATPPLEPGAPPGAPPASGPPGPPLVPVVPSGGELQPARPAGLEERSTPHATSSGGHRG